ncbi:MAG TPA: BON domain-containing protein [Rubrobacteraceae bacterium]|nr:BON domain-containing protein [Rubrobacteraceae bacterium]
MFGRTAKTAMKTRTGRKAAAKGAKGAFRFGRSDAGRGAGKVGARGLGRLAKGAAKVKAGKEAGKAGTRGFGKAGRGAGKYVARRSRKEIKIAEKNLGSRSSGGSRLMKFGLIVIAGLSIGALVGRLLNSGDSSSTSPTGTSEGQTPGGEAPASPPRAQSDPSSGPLIGTDHEPEVEGVTESQPELEQRIRTRIGEDERTREMPRVNVEVNGGVAELRGVAPSEEAKDAAGEIAAEVEGVSEVRNLLEVNS